MARDFSPRPEEASTGIGSIPSLLLSETAVDDEKDFINHWSDLRAHWHKTRIPQKVMARLNQGGKSKIESERADEVAKILHPPRLQW